METGDAAQLNELAIEAVGTFGSMPGRAPGLSSFSAYQALKRVSAEELVERIVAALLGQGMDQASARRRAVAAVDRFTKVVEERPCAGSPNRRAPPRSHGPPSARPSTTSTSSPRAARTWTRCAARSNRWPVVSRPD